MKYSKGIVFAVLAMSMTLSGCITAGQTVDAQLRSTLPQVCSAGETSYTTFQAWVAGGGKVSTRTVSLVEEAYTSLHSLCEDKDNVTVARVLTASALLAARLQNIGKE